jgi:hypothetical protein
LERQYLIFIAVAGAGFAALLVLGLFVVPLQAAPETPAVDRDVIEAELGMLAYVRYGSVAIGQIQDLPDKNILRVEASSELLNTGLAGLRGDFRHTSMTIDYVQSGRNETVDEKDFESVRFRFLPDAGNVTSYTYRNVEFNAQATSAQLIASFIPLSTAKVGEEYSVKIFLEGGPVDIGIAEKKIRIVE